MAKKDLTKTKEEMNKLYDHSCSYVHRIKDRWKNHIYFSPSADIRLGHIYGHILGLYQSGADGSAARNYSLNMLHDFHFAMDRLCALDQVATFETEEAASNGVVTKHAIQVPWTKVLLHDDGTFHSFSFLLLRPYNPFQLEEEWQAYKTQNPEFGINDFKKTKNFQDKAFGLDSFEYETTDRRYIEGKGYKIHYVSGYNGGLIYHGQGGGENFSVTLDNTFLWCSHT